MLQTLSVRLLGIALAAFVVASVTPKAVAGYTNMEVSHVHPIALTPSGSKLLAVNTPAARLEVYSVAGSGVLTPTASISVGLEPVTVRARTDGEAWVVNHLSDSISIVDLNLGTVTKTLKVGDEPSDVVFTSGKAFVAVSGEDAVKVWNLSSLDAAPQPVALFGDRVRALAVSPTGTKVYAVVQNSGNETTVINANVIKDNDSHLDPFRLSALGLNELECSGSRPPYPPLPAGVVRNPALTDPADGVPKVSLIVKWNRNTSRWEDDAGQNWNNCLPVSLPDHDLFTIDAGSLAVSNTDHLGTTLFEVSVNPANGKIYVPHTEARNAVRFEHALGVQGHVVDNRMAIVDAGVVTLVDLNNHIDRNSDPATNLAERQASISQPGMMVWRSDGTAAYLTAIGSQRIFRVDPACTSGPCIFGPNRASPSSVVVGEGPTGVALHEGANRLYVLNRFTNSIAIVNASALSKVGEVAMPDPSPATVKDGRRFLYDAVLSSGHGDAACASCHISGDLDGLAWDLGNPEGDFAPYSDGFDNVRFVDAGDNVPVPCDPADPECASKTGFDPQKGPMTTQTLRGMLEPLHWRGDRATMNSFNPAFVGLLGKADMGPVGGKPAGLSVQEMEQFRQFALAMRFPPNPLRNVNDTLPNTNVLFPDRSFQGNPVSGEDIFLNQLTDGSSSCRACHALPFGAGGGKLDGVEPQEITSLDASPLFDGEDDLQSHFDLKIPHLRNMYQKQGPVFGNHVDPPPPSKSGFGYAHDGSVPDLTTFFSINVFLFPPLNQARQVRDVSAFVLHFPTGTKPSVGQMVTVPAGPPPTGTPAQESLITTLIGLGDLADANRHCELTAFALDQGRLRHSHLSGGAWTLDRSSDTPIGTTQLRQDADGPITFLCVPLDSGKRLGGDQDDDLVLDADDCAPTDGAVWLVPGAVGNLLFETGTRLTFSVAGEGGPASLYDLASGDLAALLSSGTVTGATCLAGDVTGTSYDDLRVPAPGQGFYYLVRGQNACGAGTFGPGYEAIDTLVCP